ncbi:MAG: CotH kinase family protein, partial [Verrucomicrobiota bacterium]|nr:CotH kinase family protein [Verrucomicrobiota bacterium]
MLASQLSSQPLVISEFLASNQSGMMDEDGERSDWIEVYNPGNESVPLLGWHLSDDVEDLKKWRFPETSMAPQSSLIVFASGKDRSQPGTELHANFKLSRNGEYLGLIQPDGITVSHAFDPPYPIQLPDVSYGFTMRSDKNVHVTRDAPGKIFFPKNPTMGLSWTRPGFDDSQWLKVTLGMGYQRKFQEGDPQTPLPPPDEEALLWMDATFPTDTLDPSSRNSPVGEEVDAAIDNNKDTKYLNFDKQNAGFTVTLSRGPVAVTGLRLSSANDAPDRDPSQFILYGSKDGKNFLEVTRGDIPAFQGRFETLELSFPNEVPYGHYRIVFPTVRNAGSAVAMQIAEVAFLAWLPEAGEANPQAPTLVKDISKLEDLSRPEDAIEASSQNSPVGEEVWLAIDGIQETKYLNYDGPSSGFTIQLGEGPGVVHGLRLTSANDAPGRDPASYRLEGSSDGILYELIAKGSVPVFEDRFTTHELAFANPEAYGSYRLVFPTLRGGSGQLMQIGEVELVGVPGLPQPVFTELIRTDLESSMPGKHPSVYVRVPFRVEADMDLEGLSMGMRYEDGFVAYLNGVEVARANAPARPLFDSVATLDRDPEAAVVQEHFDLQGSIPWLHPGENVLAIHGLNESLEGSEFLLDLHLDSGITRVDLMRAGYFKTPTPGKWNTQAQLGRVPSPQVLVESGFYEEAIQVEIQSPMEGTRIYYTRDGTMPDPAQGIAYTGPIHVDQTTVLRVIATREAWMSSSPATRSFLFARDIARQTQGSVEAMGFPDRWGSQKADYGLDPRVAGPKGQDRFGGKYSQTMQEDLLSLPALSLVMDPEDLFGSKGIYRNPGTRGMAWEKPVTIEWIDPKGKAGFRENAGVRIQGGAFRKFALTLKKSFRLVFRGQYGPAKLDFPLFGPHAATSFDNVVLRANGNDGWPYGGAKALYIRDAFAMETARAMGMVAPHTRFVHLYLNGSYWGLYNLVERPDASFSSTYHGGDPDDWDALNQDSAPDGNREAWNRMLRTLEKGADQDDVLQRVQGKTPDGARDPSLENLLDVENLIDYCIMNFFLGNQDWPGRNHWMGRNRMGEDGFQFYPWDSETAIGLASDLNTNRTGVNSAVARPYGLLRSNPEFRLWFADRVQHHFFNHGALFVNPDQPRWSEDSPENNQPAARFAKLAEQVDRAMVAESARWGDQLRSRPYTRDEHWQKERDRLLQQYFPQRSAIVLEQLRRAGLFPKVDAPRFSHWGGRMAAGGHVSMQAEAGRIFYTTDGTDPRSGLLTSKVKRTVLLDASTVRRVMVPLEESRAHVATAAWYQEPGFDDRAWVTGSGGVGFDTDRGYEGLFAIDVGERMGRQNTSAFIRCAFELEEQAVEETRLMVLRMRYDDGFVAYLNGVEIARANAPETLAWNTAATRANDDTNAVAFEDFDVSAFSGLLNQGTNLLAIQGFNVSGYSSDFLIDMELVFEHRNVTQQDLDSNVYDAPVPINDWTTLRARTLSGGVWSAESRASYKVGAPSLMVSELQYHPADSSSAEIAAGFTDADAFEFIELYNAGTRTWLLKGNRFVDGVMFDFDHSSIHYLAPDAAILVVRNLAAFELRHGKGLPVAGEYSGNFSNKGERVALVDEQNEPLITFSYTDSAAGLESADGSGPSLVAARRGGAINDPGYWGLSDPSGGTPGQWPEPSSRTTILPEIHLEKGRIRIECTAPAEGYYRLFQNEDLSTVDWQPFMAARRALTHELLRFEFESPKVSDVSFYQIRSVSQ